MALYIFTGAGISAESGIQTFRGNDGLWDNHKISEICNINTWIQNYDKVHDFYNERRKLLGSVTPNRAHEMIATWSKKYDATVFTQNVDDLLEKAGCQNVIHLHGFLTEMVCQKCGKKTDIGYNSWTPDVALEHHQHCNGTKKLFIKPNVVFFHEMAPKYKILYDTLENLTSEDIFIVMGTSFQVIPIDAELFDTPCKKILADIVDNSQFDIWTKKFIGPATQEVYLIDDFLSQI